MNAGAVPSDGLPADGGTALGSVPPVGLWLAIQVTDFEPTVAFYRDAVGLPLVDGWDTDGLRGAVFAVGSTGRIEVEEVAATPSAPQVAIEYASLAELKAVRARLASRPATGGIEQHDRGHHGLTATDPGGIEIYLWSER